MSRDWRAALRSENTPVLALSAVLWLASFVLWITVLRGADPISDSLSIPWWTIGIAMLITESWLVHVHFRTETGSFSFSELPIILGVLFTSPTWLLPAAVVGALVSMTLVRHSPAVKVAFNAGNTALRVALAFTVMQLLIGPLDPLEPLGWIVVGIAAVSTSAVEVLLLAGVISLSERRYQPKAVRNMLVFGLLVAVANTVQALIMGLLLLVEPYSLLLLGLTTVVLFIAYKAYIGERHQRERVEFLYASTRALSSSNEAIEASAKLLEEAAVMFRANSVELYLPEEGSRIDDVQGTVVTSKDRETSTRPMTVEEAASLHELTELAHTPLIVGSAGRLRRFVAELGYRDALVGAMDVGGDRSGLLIVADRLDNVSTFAEEDLQLFATLVQQASLALENDQLGQALSRTRSLERELAHQASHDALTGLPNRALLHRRLEEQVDFNHWGLSLLYVDLDDFKIVNDTMGHGAGDLVLTEAARRLSSSVRPTDTAARLGGDEFAVMLVDNDDPERVAARILESLGQPYEIEGQSINVGATIGLARHENDLSAATLISRADVAMYTAKEMGKSTIASYKPDMHSKVSAQQLLRSQIKTAVVDGQFTVLYQPIVELATARIVGAEALVRWVSPDGLLLPEGFISEAEKSGLIVPIDRFVFTQVLADLTEASTLGHGHLWFSSNLSMRTLQDDGLVQRVLAEVERSQVDPRSIVLEVTETALLHDPDLAARHLERLRAAGLRIALDDFGTGYSSLSYLRRFPVDILKIAQPFVGDLAEGDDLFVRAIIELGHTLGLRVLAEGIESRASLNRLLAHDCEDGQGYFFGRPMPFVDFLALLGSTPFAAPVNRSAFAPATRL